MSVLGCAHAPPPCRKGPADDVAMGARTGAEGAKTGAKTGLEGVKTAGRTVGGLFAGGSQEAAKQWNDGKKTTKETAKDGSSDVAERTKVPRCEE